MKSLTNLLIKFTKYWNNRFARPLPLVDFEYIQASWWMSLHEKYSYSESLWSVFSLIRTGKILRITPYSVRMRETTDQKNSEYRHFSRSVSFLRSHNFCKVFELFYCLCNLAGVGSCRQYGLFILLWWVRLFLFVLLRRLL